MHVFGFPLPPQVFVSPAPRVLMKLRLALAFLLALPALAHAQQIPLATLTGTVTDDSTGVPLAGAHVFVASSMQGTTTDDQGRYRIEGVPIGALRLYATTLGYEPEAKDVVLREGGLQLFHFKLKRTALELPEVTVEAKDDPAWRRRLERFITLFIGETPNAAETEILNPYVLDFEQTAGVFKARAAEPLVIENRALGYRVQYFLKDFMAWSGSTRWDGEPLFEEMVPEDAAQAAMWEANRRRAFMGSFRHFALALLGGQVKEQGFLTYSTPAFDVRSAAGAAGEATPMQAAGFDVKQRFPIEPDEIFEPSENPNEVVLDFHGAVEIIYQGELEDPAYLEWRGSGRRGSKPKYQKSWIQLQEGPAVLDYKGDLAGPYSVIFFGYYAFERIADTVPREFRPRA